MINSEGAKKEMNVRRGRGRDVLKHGSSSMVCSEGLKYAFSPMNMSRGCFGWV